MYLYNHGQCWKCLCLYIRMRGCCCWQWVPRSQCKVGSHWLSRFLEWSLHMLFQILSIGYHIDCVCLAMSCRRMMTSSNGNIFRVTGHLCREFTGHRWIPRTMASNAKFWCFSLICAWLNGWIKNGETGDLRRHRAHYDVIVMHWD